jgi:hypothetical protein
MTTKIASILSARRADRRPASVDQEPGQQGHSGQQSHVIVQPTLFDWEERGWFEPYGSPLTH